MKFKIDENLPPEIAEMLRTEGYDATTAAEEGLSGKDDKIIADVCKTEAKVLVTLDTDFADIRSYPPGEYKGIVVMRLRRQDKFYVIKIFEGIVKMLKAEKVEKKLWIVDETHVRIRD
jgi:predicted nuclease of predicted toxin-antitoxin system